MWCRSISLEVLNYWIISNQSGSCSNLFKSVQCFFDASTRHSEVHKRFDPIYNDARQRLQTLGNFGCLGCNSGSSLIRPIGCTIGKKLWSIIHVMSCHVMSCHVMSCHVMSCHVIHLEPSCPWFRACVLICALHAKLSLSTMSRSSNMLDDV